MREFKDSISGRSKDEDDEDDERPALEATVPTPVETRAPGERVSEPRA